ncbi:MAG TPA: response regulator [Hellea balneolensis]|uniref:Response regulator n=1 Tax=Hellea balneolensis TaxID=287478 RepID=A0A7C3FZQ0_9PROT|nr:response regulator [Hellea balneolensis]
MSPDDILASNLWLWPDPILKRNAQGQVLFVNAAFLNLYGGQAQSWHGQIVNGWPSPVQQGAQRFETRAGQSPQENIFDWVEMSMTDGNALAIARNVTALLASAAPAPLQQENREPQQPHEQQPHEEASLVPNAPPLDVSANQAPSPEQQAPQSPTQTLRDAPLQAPQLDDKYEDTLSHTADDYRYEDGPKSPTGAADSIPQNAPTLGQTDIDVTQNHDPDLEQIPAPASESKSSFEHISDQEPHQTSQQTPADTERASHEERRMAERRALPIKDSEAILGSNWRDQVIAKAIGVSAEDMDNSAQPEEQSEHPHGDPQDNDDAANGTAAAGINILLAEDNAINALLTRTLLEAEGAIVETVEDGALAVDAVRQKTYDLVFMDMRMPVMDGLEATRKIRAMGGKCANMPIIALTANAFDDDRNACFDSGMNDYMTKPVSAEELVEMVTTWIKPEESQEGEEKLAS